MTALDPIIAQLHARRRASGMSLRAVAAASGTSFQYLSKVERGEHQPSLWWLRQVAQVLGLEPGPLRPLAYNSTLLGPHRVERGAGSAALPPG